MSFHNREIGQEKIENKLLIEYSINTVKKNKTMIQFSIYR